MILGNAAYSGSAFGNFSDPNFNYVSLLLTGAGGANATTNNTFLDSSQYAQTITRNGDATQGSFTPYNGNYYSAYFDGSTDYLTTPSIALSTTDFTWEAWLYRTATKTIETPFVYPANNGLSIGFESSGTQITLSRYGIAYIAQISTTVPLNQWFHLAVSKSSNVYRVFVNGTQVGTTYTDATAIAAGAYNIGADSVTAGREITGYISNLRLVIGSALYTSNFTPSTAPLTAIANTSLLTCQSNRFIDNSVNNFAITRNGDVSIQAFDPFVFQGLAYSPVINGSSMYFDGTGDFLTSASNTTMDWGTGDFTVEAWIYPTALSTNRIIAERWSASSGWQLYWRSTGTSLTWYVNATIVLQDPGTTNIALNSWSHVAVSRSGTTTRMFVNGALVASATDTNNYTYSLPLTIGRQVTTGTNDFSGYITDFRTVKGVARYTAAFTPPPAPLQPIPGTTLLLRGANAAIFDRTRNNPLVTVGDAQLSTTVRRYNSTSMSFDGTGDYIVQPTSISYGYGTGDFTIEFWLYLNALTTQTICSHLSSAASINPHIYYLSGTGIIYYTNSADRITGSALTTGAWNYIAVCRSSGSTRLFINGTQSGSTYTDSNNYGASAPLGVGTYWSSGAPVTTQTLNGYIDDLRITRGIARYTANFTPPTFSPLGF